MYLDFDSDKPIFLQIAEGIEDAILSGGFPEESQIPSITEFATTFKINPATALKGINMLVDAGIVYKKRGVGMFVADGAVKMLKSKRQETFYESYVKTLLDEAKRLGITLEEIKMMLERGLEK